MAAPTTHIVLANKVFDNFFLKSKKDFFIGTSFPDIRYLKVIDRDITHFKNTTLNLKTLNLDNSFIAGAKIHVIVDEIRENYIVAHDIYSYLPKSKYIARSLKLLEDELLYEKIISWEYIIKDFENIPYEQINFSLDKKHIEKWYLLLRKYFLSKPTPQIRKKFIEEIGFRSEDADEMNKLIEAIRNNEQIRKIIYGLFDNFELLLKVFAAKEKLKVSDKIIL